MGRRQKVWKLIVIFLHVRLSKEQFSAQTAVHFHSEVRIVYSRQQLHHRKDAEETYSCNRFDFQSVLFNFRSYLLPILLVIFHFFCLWCDNSQGVLWYFFSLTVIHRVLRQGLYYSFRFVIYFLANLQMRICIGTVKHFLTWTFI